MTEQGTPQQLTFNTFQAANIERASSAFPPQCLTPEFLAVAIAGEAGELANLIKKVMRGDYTTADKRKEITDEIADVMTYCDLFMSVMRAETEKVLVEKWNEVSDRRGWKHLVAAASLPERLEYPYARYGSVHNGLSQPSPSGDALRDPSPEELESPLFNAIWNAIKGWDLRRTRNRLYSGATGTDVCIILDALRSHDAKVGLAEQRLREALQNVIESSIDDADCCTICGNDVTEHSPGCAIERAEAALQESR